MVLREMPEIDVQPAPAEWTEYEQVA
jgi:hypothetical protein